MRVDPKHIVGADLCFLVHLRFFFRLILGLFGVCVCVLLLAEMVCFHRHRYLENLGEVGAHTVFATAAAAAAEGGVGRDEAGVEDDVVAYEVLCQKGYCIFEGLLFVNTLLVQQYDQGRLDDVLVVLIG